MVSMALKLATPDPRYDHIPERVRVAIQDQQDASERVIGIVQLAVVLLFGTLYLSTPKAFAANAAFEPVPWALSGYLAFTLLRILLAYRGRIGPPILYLSVVIAMGLLFGLIWSFHLQYQQPPSFYLKAPSLLYVFIFIALRALRFEARYVVAAGLVAATGWVLMAGYAIYASGGTEMVTRDYVYYMTSNSILIGAEIDKVVSILTVTVIIAFAIERARRLLIRAVAEGAAAQELSRFFSPEIAQQIKESEQIVHAGQAEARDAAILNCDIRGFTRFTTLVRPDELMAMLTEYQARMVPIIQRHGGAVDKFMGDGIMATFGAVIPTETFAADSLRAIDDIVAAAADWNTMRAGAGKPILQVGAAVSTGRIVFGAVGDASRLEYTVIGDAVNVSAKLEKHTKVEKVRALADEASFALALEQGYVPPRPRPRLPARAIDGVERPIDLVVLAR
jgi:adenylate cyclase